MEIRKVGDEVLRQPAHPVKKINKGVKTLLDEMTKAMYEASGVGLAAPQVGVSKRVIVADVGEGLVELINPEILYLEGTQVGLEGCLSVPDVIGEVERAEKVRVTGLNRQGYQVWVDANGLMSRCLQHEIDHLNGILFTDRALKLMPADAERDPDEVVLD